MKFVGCFLKPSSILIAVAAISLTACSSGKIERSALVQTVNHQSVVNMLDSDIDNLWSKNFDHHQSGLLKQVADTITHLAGQKDLSHPSLDKLTYYLRIYASFGPDEGWIEHTAEALNRALLSLHDMPGFFDINATTARLHENYAVALYRLYFLKPLHANIQDHVKPLSRLIRRYADAALPNDKAVDYALWEILRAAAILPYDARRENQPEYIQAISDKGQLQQALIDFVTAANATRHGDNWPQQHAVWALAHYYNLYDKQYWNAYEQRPEEEQKQLDEGKISLPFEQKMTDLDNTLWASLSADKNKSVEQVKDLFTTAYVVSTYRGQSECSNDTLKDRCIIPTLEQALPIEHHCSDSLYILAQAMTKAQLNQTCTRLTSQESTFHQKLLTGREPVANDHNHRLRVVVFDDQAQYNRYGQLVFDINTENGGMYIEGTAQNPDNIATFYAYEHFWARPEFKVWNLNHEYVHYLDGRFVKYDGYGHFPGQLVWWSEGLAEYISKDEHNTLASSVLVKTEQAKWPTLQGIFDTKYQDSLDQIYRWGYWAVRYMVEEHHEDYLTLANFLKTDYFDGYKKHLDESGEKYQQDFVRWLAEHKNRSTVVHEKIDKRQPRQFYRYSYKEYLKPAYLTEDPLHMVWQYWHANALASETVKIK